MKRMSVIRYIGGKTRIAPKIAERLHTTGGGGCCWNYEPSRTGFRRPLNFGGMMSKCYVQDKRQYVGNSMLWWAKDCNGYTCDIRKAHVFDSEAEAHLRADRKTDVVWPKDYIDARISHHIDMQHVDRAQIPSEGGG